MPTGINWYLQWFFHICPPLRSGTGRLALFTNVVTQRSEDRLAFDLDMTLTYTLGLRGKKELGLIPSRKEFKRILCFHHQGLGSHKYLNGRQAQPPTASDAICQLPCSICPHRGVGRSLNSSGLQDHFPDSS